MYIANNDIKLAGQRYKAGDAISADVVASIPNMVLDALVNEGHLATDGIEPVVESVTDTHVTSVTAFGDNDYTPTKKRR